MIRIGCVLQLLVYFFSYCYLHIWYFIDCCLYHLNYTEPDFVCVVYNGGDFGDIPSCGVCNVVYNVVYNEATPHDGVCASET
jgi:hypothetical protein